MPDEPKNVDRRDIQDFAATFGDIPITPAGHRWWRGHVRRDWRLVPSVLRERGPRYEFNVAQRFHAKARTRYANCPPENDKAGWMFLMQHYGLPTRILDWSESLSVGLYFAVNELEYDNEPGCLWGLDPSELNHAQNNTRGIFGYADPRVTAVFSMGFREPNPRNVHPTFAIGAKEVDMRMLIQQSVFTIHGNSTALEDLSNRESFLQRIEIPAKLKPSLRGVLNFLGIRESYLFPDLEHLANELKGYSFQGPSGETEEGSE